MATPTIRRADFNHSLVHLTRERLEYSESTNSFFDPQKLLRTVQPFEVLKEILNSGKIRGSGNDGFVKGNQKAVCLSEIPLSAVSDFASRPEHAEARYRFYGIALSKEAVFSAGGRPVIYLPDNEGQWIPPDHKWRHVRFEMGTVDFTHEREWRVLGDLDLTKVPGIYVLVWSPSEAKEVYEMTSPVSERIRGVLPMEHITQML